MVNLALMTGQAEAEKELELDAQLMLLVGQGDDKALATLIDRWKNPLINFFYRSLNSREQAEDLAQMVFIRLHRAAGRYEPRAKFSTYLFQIARRLLINELRRQQRKPLEPVDPVILGSTNAQEHSTRDYREIEEAFHKALEGLPENQRSAILLLQQQELSYDEIAEILGATTSAVKTWIFRARQHLKEALKDLV